MATAQNLDIADYLSNKEKSTLDALNESANKFLKPRLVSSRQNETNPKLDGKNTTNHAQSDLEDFLAKESTDKNNKLEISGESKVCAQTIKNLLTSLTYKLKAPVQLIKPNLLTPI